MKDILLVGIGGFIGAVLRYSVSGWVQQWTGSARFPYGTLAVNVLGSFVIGLLLELVDVLLEQRLRLRSILRLEHLDDLPVLFHGPPDAAEAI